VSSAAITVCVASQRVTPKVSVHFVIDSVRKLSDAPSYISGTSVSHRHSIHKEWRAQGSVHKATGYSLDNRDSRSGRERDYSLCHCVRTYSETHSDSYTMDTAQDSLLGGKAAGA
jgi:hypothetical protein